MSVTKYDHFTLDLVKASNYREKSRNLFDHAFLDKNIGLKKSLDKIVKLYTM